jgi:putative FmdB family regulatory protein
VLVYNTFFRRNHMPIYEYQCKKCGAIEEALQKFSDKPLSKCKHCSGKLHKLVSQSSFHLKGSGWYVTDYANKHKDTAPANEKKNEGPDSAKPEKEASPGKMTPASSENKPLKTKESTAQKNLKNNSLQT